MNTTQQPQPAPGDYYGTIYKGSLILPVVLVLLVLAVGMWWIVKRRK